MESKCKVIIRVVPNTNQSLLLVEQLTRIVHMCKIVLGHSTLVMFFSKIYKKKNACKHWKPINNYVTVLLVWVYQHSHFCRCQIFKPSHFNVWVSKIKLYIYWIWCGIYIRVRNLVETYVQAKPMSIMTRIKSPKEITIGSI